MDHTKFDDVLLEARLKGLRVSPSAIADHFEKSVQNLTGCTQGEATEVLADLNKIAPSTKHSLKDLASKYLTYRANGDSHGEAIESCRKF